MFFAFRITDCTWLFLGEKQKLHCHTDLFLFRIGMLLVENKIGTRKVWRNCLFWKKRPPHSIIVKVSKNFPRHKINCDHTLPDEFRDPISCGREREGFRRTQSHQCTRTIHFNKVFFIVSSINLYVFLDRQQMRCTMLLSVVQMCFFEIIYSHYATNSQH